MPVDWSALVERSDGTYDESQFKQAMYQLVIQQCLYLRNRDQVTSYRLISSYRDAFAEAVALMGLRLGFNETYEYCYVVQDSGALSQMDLMDTFFLLTLRYVYHARASVGDLSLAGDAVVGVAEFEESFKNLCHREFEGKGDALRGLMRMASRHGLARMIDAPEGDPQPFAIAILPGISEVLSEHSVSRFGADLKARAVIAASRSKN